jgi:hypothetical protein
MTYRTTIPVTDGAEEWIETVGTAETRQDAEKLGRAAQRARYSFEEPVLWKVEEIPPVCG